MSATGNNAGSDLGDAAESAPLQVPINRTSLRIEPDSSRVLVKPFLPGNAEKCQWVIQSVLDLSDSEAESVLLETLKEFHGRHLDLKAVLYERFLQVRQFLLDRDDPSHPKCLLIGAYFMSEYALESAALFNPSIVPDPDQTGISENSLRVVISLRATGEGHISSIEFRTAIIDGMGNFNVEPGSYCITAPLRVDNPRYEKKTFRMKMQEIGLHDQFSAIVMDSLGAEFTLAELEEAIGDQASDTHAWGGEEEDVARRIRWLAQSNYEVHFPSSIPLSQRIIYPQSPTEEQGIEDARFVQFFDDDGSMTYYATYTAWDGQITLPQLIETDDFLHFKLSTLNGRGVRNKGMALFPRRIGGKYAMVSRLDDHRLYIMYSDDIHFWRKAHPLAEPKFNWEFLKIGNCGSPMETPQGWLLLTHGVGPMRRYCIGAMLLDLEDPTRLIGRLERPLIEPEWNEREGYVPNVVYTCGALIHRGQVIIPYAMSDYATTVATVDLDQLLAALCRGG